MQLLEQRLAIEAVNPYSGARRYLPDQVQDESAIPDFHHGAGHKILQYWPRLRVNLTLPDVNVLTYLNDLDRKDAFLARQGNHFETYGPQVSTADAIEVVTSFYDSIGDLPISLRALLMSCGLFHKDRMLQHPHALSEHPDLARDTFNAQDLSLEELLIYSLAFQEKPDATGSSTFRSNELSKAWFKRGLERLWELSSEPEDRVVPLMVGYAHAFLYVFARPFHALGLSQNVYTAIEGLLKRSGNRSFDSHALLYSKLHFTLQSDILTEIDGNPTMRTPQSQDLDVEMNTSQERTLSDASPFHSATLDDRSWEYYLDCNIWLRTCLNRVIGHMYTTEKAYCRPHEVGGIISSVSSELDQWYRGLPLDLQFIRNVMSFKVLVPQVPQRLLEISLRYHACQCFLNRPVLYFVLYQDFEQSAAPNGNSGAPERHLEPWVLESCCHCIDSSKLIILNLAQNLQLLHPTERSPQVQASKLGPRPDWCQIQLLVSAYAVLISVQTATAFSPALRDAADIDWLLDLAEMVLSTVTATSLGLTRTLEILVNIRTNIRMGSSPL